MNKRQIWASIAVASFCGVILILLTDIEGNVVQLIECNLISQNKKKSQDICL